MKALSAVDPKLLEEAAHAALDYGRYSAEDRPLEQAVERIGGGRLDEGVVATCPDGLGHITRAF